LKEGSLRKGWNNTVVAPSANDLEKNRRLNRVKRNKSEEEKGWERNPLEKEGEVSMGKANRIQCVCQETQKRIEKSAPKGKRGGSYYCVEAVERLNHVPKNISHEGAW